MDTSIQKRKTLSIDFDLHTDGDEEFKCELVTLMIDNIKELQESLREATKQRNTQLFRDCCHKVTPTISILDSKEFMDTIEDIKQQNDEVKKESTIASFNKLCIDIISSLKLELK